MCLGSSWISCHPEPLGVHKIWLTTYLKDFIFKPTEFVELLAKWFCFASLGSMGDRVICHFWQKEAEQWVDIAGWPQLPKLANLFGPQLYYL